MKEKRKSKQVSRLKVLSMRKSSNDSDTNQQDYTTGENAETMKYYHK